MSSYDYTKPIQRETKKRKKKKEKQEKAKESSSDAQTHTQKEKKTKEEVHIFLSMGAEERTWTSWDKRPRYVWSCSLVVRCQDS